MIARSSNGPGTEPGLTRIRLLLVLLPAAIFWSAARGLPAQENGSAEASVETDPVVARLDERIRLFFEALDGDDRPAAFRQLLVDSELLEQKEAVEQLIERYGKLMPSQGRSVAVEQVGVRRLGADLVLLRYLQKGERLPVVWFFAFYRTPSETTPGNGNPWRVITMHFHTDFTRLLK